MYFKTTWEELVKSVTEDSNCIVSNKTILMLAWIRDKVGEHTLSSALVAKSCNIFSLLFGAYLLLRICQKHKENTLMGISVKVPGRVIFCLCAFSLHIWFFPLLLNGLYLIVAVEKLLNTFLRLKKPGTIWFVIQHSKLKAWFLPRPWEKEGNSYGKKKLFCKLRRYD